MDEKTAERINELARSLKELHLAASMEEAQSRARDIILGTSAEEKARTVTEMLHESSVKDRECAQKARELKKAAEDLHKAQVADELSHDAQRADAQAALKAVEKTREELVLAKSKLEFLEAELKKIEKAYREAHK